VIIEMERHMIIQVIMKKNCFLYLCLLLVLSFSNGHAQTQWADDFESFTYNIISNGGTFSNEPASWLEAPSSSCSKSYNYSQGETDPYDSVCEEEVINLPDQRIRMSAMAKGPDGGTNPENGLKVQAYAQIEFESPPNQDDGLMVAQKIRTWVSRQFTVTEEYTYKVEGSLSGEVDFFTWVDGDDPLFHFSEFLSATVSVIQLTLNEDDEVVVTPVTTLTVDAFEKEESETLILSPPNQDGYPAYQLKPQIFIETEIVNMDFMYGNIPPDSIDHLNDNNFYIGTPDEPVALEATIRKVARLTTRVVGGQGSISPADKDVDYGESEVLVADPEDQWKVASWYGTDDDASTGETNSVTMDSPKHVFVQFRDESAASDRKYLSAVVLGGEGTLSPGNGIYDEDETVTVTANPAEGWEVASWKGTADDGSTENANSVTMDKDKIVTVSFVELQYALLATVSEGQGTISPETGIYTPGETVTLTAQPADGWEVSSWTGTGDDDSDAETNTVVMNSDKSVSVIFSRIPIEALPGSSDSGGCFIISSSGE